ncbi:hypothetical protein LEL_02993 [Akanthomyces lecanii RCEF 1005]|uniref:Uncharacterized protein n=1 Tax=Akanthomyces lecanii RCEF 1005 TaxID=1081108 RepID=A0A168IPG6_CORDF|nr:hypothetical protein LEL_02993 [Akanthomyces lecanii RCEF 1005]
MAFYYKQTAVATALHGVCTLPTRRRLKSYLRSARLIHSHLDTTDSKLFNLPFFFLVSSDDSGVWENADFLRELCLALFQVASNGGALSTQARSAVEVYLKI